MIKYIIYTQKACGYCNKAKELLAELNLEYEERLLDTPERVKKFKERGYKTVPQIFKHVGGFTELQKDLKENIWKNIF